METLMPTRNDRPLSQLDAVIKRYETYFTGVPDYNDHLKWLIARYSRGDELQDIANSFSVVVDKAVETDRLNRQKYKTTKPYFTHDRKYATLYRDALVLLSLAVCFKAPAAQVHRLLDCCERGDPLIELLAGAGGETPATTTTPAFPQFFEEFYAAMQATGTRRISLLGSYLDDWPGRFDEFGFLLIQEDAGYWCFEAAGIVAALNIEHGSLASRAHYPADLVDYHRGRRLDRA